MVVVMVEEALGYRIESNGRFLSLALSLNYFLKDRERERENSPASTE